jgi:hypothetical protein
MGNELELMEKRGAQPQRTCIVCRDKRAKKYLIRLVLDDKGRVSLDHRQHLYGRGAYVCPRAECLARVKLAHLNKAFRQKLSADSWNHGMAMVEALKGCMAH